MVDFTISDTPSEADLRIIDEGLDGYNHGAAPVADVKQLAIFARGSSGRMIGGALGRTWGSCCELLQLWVEQSHRKSGIGSRLLREFEGHARNTLGCRVFYLTTLSFQAPEFYRKHEYDILAQIDGYPNGIVKYLMHKTKA